MFSITAKLIARWMLKHTTKGIFFFIFFLEGSQQQIKLRFFFVSHTHCLNNFLYSGSSGLKNQLNIPPHLRLQPLVCFVFKPQNMWSACTAQTSFPYRFPPFFCFPSVFVSPHSNEALMSNIINDLFLSTLAALHRSPVSITFMRFKLFSLASIKATQKSQLLYKSWLCFSANLTSSGHFTMHILEFILVCVQRSTISPFTLTLMTEVGRSLAFRPSLV